MYVLYDSSGAIQYCVDADSPKSSLTRIPNGTTALYLDDAEYANVKNDYPEYTIQNGTPVYTPIPEATKLANAQQVKIERLVAARDIAIFGTFQSSCTGTAYTYGADAISRSRYNYLATRSYNDTTFTGQTLVTHDDVAVSHTPQQLIQLAADGATHESNVYFDCANRITQVKNSTTIDAVNSVSEVF